MQCCPVEPSRSVPFGRAQSRPHFKDEIVNNLSTALEGTEY